MTKIWDLTPKSLPGLSTAVLKPSVETYLPFLWPLKKKKPAYFQLQMCAKTILGGLYFIFQEAIPSLSKTPKPPQPTGDPGPGLARKWEKHKS